jgi:putative spermidine/putrescine transport system permease protein
MSVATATAEHATRRPLPRRLRFPLPLLLLLPALALFLVFFVLPLAVLVVNSFYDYSRLTGIVPTFTFKNYDRILWDVFHLEIILRTLRLAFLTSLVTLIVGYPIALYLTVTSPRRRAWIILFILSPLLVSVIVRTFGWLIILGPNGLLHGIFSAFGLEGGVFLHSEGAVIAGLVNVLLPFLILAVATSLQAIDPAVPRAAASLGAGPWRVFRLVIFPLSLPGVIAGLLIVFSLASSSFVTPALLGGADFKVMSTMIYQQALILQNWPLAAAFAVALVLVVFLVLFVQARVIEGGRYRVVFH